MEKMFASRRELNKIKSRKRILKASRKLFSEKGYEETMMDDIAKKAEVSKATIYNYFPNKESLLVGTADEVLERVRDLVEKGFVNKENSEEKLRKVLEEFVVSSVDYLELSRRITVLNSSEESPLYKTRKEMVEILKDLITGCQEEGIFLQEANPSEIVDVVMGIYLIAQFEWTHIGKYEMDFLRAKLNRFFDVMLSPYRV